MLDSTLSNFEFAEWLLNTLTTMETSASTTPSPFTLTIPPSSQPNIAPGGTPPADAESKLDVQVQRSIEFLKSVRLLLLNGSLYNTTQLRELLVIPPISSSQFIVQRKSFTTSCTFRAIAPRSSSLLSVYSLFVSFTLVLFIYVFCTA